MSNISEIASLQGKLCSLGWPVRISEYERTTEYYFSKYYNVTMYHERVKDRYCFNFDHGDLIGEPKCSDTQQGLMKIIDTFFKE